MLDELCSLIHQGKLTAPACTEVGLQEYRKALDSAMQPFTSAKQVLIMWPDCTNSWKQDFWDIVAASDKLQ